MPSVPTGPADPRDRPYYIDPLCPQCGAVLVLADLLEDPACPTGQIWYDEWECPQCRDGLYLDWSEQEIADFYDRGKES